MTEDELTVARAIWDALVSDEPPLAEELERLGYVEAAHAALVVLTERGSTSNA